MVAFSLVTVAVALLPAVRELQRAARSLEKLSDTLSKELPPTLEALRLTGLEIGELSEEVSSGVKNAGEAIEQVNQGVSGVRQQAQRVRGTTRSLAAGVRTAWQVWRNPGHTQSEERSELP
jgi:methyl-accepting chemotaxis protein